MKINWLGTDTVNVLDARKCEYNGRYFSDREEELVSNMFDTIIVEDYDKWYWLYYLTHDEAGNEKLVCFTYGDIIDGIDHNYYPNTVVKFALANNLKIDKISYIAICKQFIAEMLESVDDIISDDYLPQRKDLEKVLVDGNGHCNSYNLHAKYDSCTWENYCVVEKYDSCSMD